jgi:hypothetical protein
MVLGKGCLRDACRVTTENAAQFFVDASFVLYKRQRLNKLKETSPNSEVPLRN